MGASADDTKRRLLDAAAVEFATHGVAGARTSRIAAAAQANEALLFRYFGSKQSLFERVYDELVERTVGDISIDAEHLPEYAGALFDYYEQHQDLLRLSIWSVLEHPRSSVSPAVSASTAQKTEAIERAQRSGVVANILAAGELLALIVQLSMSGASVSPSLGPKIDPVVRRASIVAAVRILVEPSCPTAVKPESTDTAHA